MDPKENLRTEARPADPGDRDGRAPLEEAARPGPKRRLQPITVGSCYFVVPVRVVGDERTRPREPHRR